MADTELTGLTEDTAPASDSLIYTVDDPAGTPASRKTTLANLAKGLVINNVTDLAAPAVGDELLLGDISASNVARKADVASVVNLADHDQLTNFVANEHIDHSGVQIATAATSGLSGGGTIAATRNIVIAPGQTTDKATPVAADLILIGDSAASNAIKSADAQSVANLAKPIESFLVAVSDETTDLTTGTAKVTFRMPYAFTLTEVRANVNTAPVGATITVDINEAGTTILSTKLTIDASEKTSESAATPAVISDTALADDAEMTIDIDQVGSSTAGKGLKVALIGRRA